MFSTGIVIPAAALAAVLACPAIAQGPVPGQTPPMVGSATDAAGILRLVAERYRAPRTLEIEFSVIHEIERKRDGLASESKSQASAVVRAQAPDRLRVEARDSEYAVVKVADGRIRWLYLPDVKIYARHEADAEGNAVRPAREDPRFEALANEAAAVARRYATIDQPQGGRQSATIAGEETLEVSARKLPCRIVEIRETYKSGAEIVRRLWVEKYTYLVWREISSRTSEKERGAQSRSTSTWNFGRVLLNEALPERLFTFVAPPDAGLVTALPRLGAAGAAETPPDNRPSPGGWPPVVTNAPGVPGPVASRVPELLEPRPGAVLENGGVGRNTQWEFRWTACQDASRYHLQIKAGGARVPIVDFPALQAASYLFRPGEMQFPEANLEGWVWRVRCQAAGGQWSGWAESTFDVQPAKAVVNPDLPAPKLVAPADQSVFDHFPRETVLVWRAVPGAAAYRIEIDYSSQGTWASESRGSTGLIVTSRETSCTHMFVGAQPGRWRVWAVDADGVPGAKSEWWEFRYTR